MPYIHNREVFDFIGSLDNDSVDLVATDPPFYGVVNDGWDNRWANDDEFAEWLENVFVALHPKLKQGGSIVFFGGTGFQNNRGLFKTIIRMDKSAYTYQDFMTWKKLRAYGKPKEYLYTREEMVWYSKGDDVTFNIPYLTEKQTNRGWNPKYQTKSEFKRVSNVWVDIPELFKTRRRCEKPVPLYRRIVETHSNPGDLVVDPFCGLGGCGVASLTTGRRFIGNDGDPDAAAQAETDCQTAVGNVDILNLIS